MCKFRQGEHIRILEQGDVVSHLRGRRGIIETVEKTPQGCVYTARLVSRPQEVGKHMIANTLAEEWLEHAHNANQVHKLGNQLGYDLALCGYCDKVVEYELGEGEGKLAGQWRNPTMDERRLVPELT